MWRWLRRRSSVFRVCTQLALQSWLLSASVLCAQAAPAPESSEQTPPAAPDATQPAGAGDAADAQGFGDAPVNASADATGFGDAPAGASADAAGFGDAASFGTSGGVSESSEPSPWSLGATLRIQSALRVEQLQVRGLALGKLRDVVEAHVGFKYQLGAELYLRMLASGRMEADFAYLMNYDEYYRATNDVYAWQLLPRETYIALDWSALQISVGEQVVNFGQADMLTLLDVINPRDAREPLLSDISEVHMPVLMTRVGLNIDRVRSELVIVHEPYFGLLPPPLGEFSPLRKLVLANPTFANALGERNLVNRHVPKHSLADLGATQFHGRLSWGGSGLDLKLLASSLLDSLGVPNLPSAEGFASDTIALTISHPRYSMLGHSGAWTLGPVMIYWEAVFDINRPLVASRTDSNLLLWSTLRRSAARGLLGLTYAPSTTTSAALEVAKSYVIYSPERSPELHLELLYPIELPQFAVRFNQALFRERVHLGLLFVLIGAPRVNAWAVRADLSYALQDRLELALGYVTYQPSRDFGPFYGFERNDRVFLNVRWDVGD